MKGLKRKANASFFKRFTVTLIIIKIIIKINMVIKCFEINFIIKNIIIIITITTITINNLINFIPIN
jgi:hypothetical protein